MRYFTLLLFIGFVVVSCTKDKVPAPMVSNYYQSQGNLLILKIGTNLEGIYEYNLASTVLNNDSLPLCFSSYTDGINYFNYLKFTPNPDTLLQISANNFTFFTNQIDKINLQYLNSTLPFDAVQFQSLGTQNNINYAQLWSKISNLDLVKTYRNSNPNSKIGINRIVINVYDEQLGISVPNAKYLIFLAK